MENEFMLLKVFFLFFYFGEYKIIYEKYYKTDPTNLYIFLL